MGPIDVERVRVLYLNSRNMLIRDELVSEGSIDQSAIYVREVVKRAQQLGAAELIIVHHHPSGNPDPSRTAISITLDIPATAAKLEMAAHKPIPIDRTVQRTQLPLALLCTPTIHNSHL